MKTLKSIIDKKIENVEFREAFNEYEKEFQIARQIIKYRKKMGMTQTELAKKANTSQSAIARLESGVHQNITLSFLNKVCNAMNIIPEIKFKKKQRRAVQ